jgi:hypothetical protein
MENMSMATMGELLKYFKKTEAAENIIPLVESEELRNGLVAWKSVAIKYKDNSECELKDEASRWDWMWNQVEYDVKKFGVVAGIAPQHAQQLLIRLQGLRLIYPDGTVNSFASKYLQAIIMSKLPKQK